VESSRRGPYAKGVAKREEILTQALTVVAERGVQDTSVKAIADAVGLSPAGVLHYFSSKEELFTEVLRKRDEVDSQRVAGLDWGGLGEASGSGEPIDVASARKQFVELLESNSDVPGLLRLFTQLAAEAADPEHPAHGFFRERGELFRSLFAAVFAQHNRDHGRTRVDPEVAARMLQALADGLQLQALLEPDVDMAGIADAFFDAVLGD